MSKYKAYPSYKDSGVEWLGEIPNDWSASKLKYCLSSIIAGGTPKTTENAFWCDAGDGIPWVSIADMTKSNIVIKTKKDVTLKGVADKGLKILPEGTILYSIFASLGKVSFSGTKLTTNQAILGLIPNNKIDKTFLYWVLIALEGYVKFTASSNTQDNLNTEKVANFPIALPLQEQQTIANYLDTATAKIDTLIAKQTKLIELLAEKRQAVISTAVTRGLDSTVAMKESGVAWLGEIPEGWSISLLKRYCNITDGSHHSPPVRDTGFPFISVTDVGHNTINFKDCKKISEEDFNRLIREGCQPKVGDVLLTKDGTIGRAAIVQEEYIPFVILSSLGLLSPNIKLNNFYLYYYLISGLNIDQMNSMIHGSALKRMTISKIDNLFISFPELEEQVMIVKYLNDKTQTIDTLISKATQAIALLKERRTALISAVVTGKVKVNGEAREDALGHKVNGEAREDALGYKVNGEAREGALGQDVRENV